MARVRFPPFPPCQTVGTLAHFAPMRRSFRLPALTIVLAGFVLTACPAPSERSEGEAIRGLSAAARGWNVVLISVDTLRADHLNAYGYATRKTSPWIDSLIGQGVRFDRAQAPRSLTWPSLASVMTGLYPRSHGVTTNGYQLVDALQTLPELLQAAGYQTGAFLGNMCPGANHQGWDRRVCKKDPKIGRAALRWLQEVDPARPFFLWTHWMGAHSPFRMGGRLAAELDPGYEGPIRPNIGAFEGLMRDGVELDEADLRHVAALYDASIIVTDRRLRALFGELAPGGRPERTLFVFLADHGEELFQHHGYLTHACSVYQNGLRVPLAFTAPPLVEAGGAVDAWVELIDVAPTVLELVGVEAPRAMDGKSLVPYLERPGRGGQGRPAFSEWPGQGLRTVSAGDWKLIDNPEGFRPVCFKDAPPDFFALERVELYDLAADRAERRNLAAEHPRKVAELRALIEERFDTVLDRGLEQEVPDEIRRELQALGYVN